MLKIIPNLPDNVLGISAEGEVTGKDYESILIPAVEEKLKSHEKISLLYHLGNNFSGFNLAAMFDDAKIGIKHLASWQRIAFVSDHEMINTLVKFFGYLFPAEVRIFKNEALNEAIKWISQK